MMTKEVMTMPKKRELQERIANLEEALEEAHDLIDETLGIEESEEDEGSEEASEED